MKMLVTSSLFTVSPRPILPPSPVETSSKTTSISTATVVTVKEGPSPPPPVQTQHPPPLFLKPSLEKEVESWPDNSQHGSPVPRPVGRGKRLTEGGNTPTSTSSSTPTPTPTTHPPGRLMDRAHTLSLSPVRSVSCQSEVLGSL
ncbi:proline-rich receptor-like protein kinase PERK8, partial [Homalodisca vitripennis]|uniref:proline-rich receptor-like protein kinase PERK8 n=1 Tax=Homalodisca vitripennis TaxID=197043 RepID=UPI001EEBBBAF